MNPLNRFLHTTSELEEPEAELLNTSPVGRFAVEVRPPEHGEIPETLDRFTRNIMEIQSSTLGWKNASPITTFEIIRGNPGQTRLQFVAETKRLERKIRTHLSEEIPRIGFDTGVKGLPVVPGDHVGGGLLTMGRRDHYPLKTSFDRPPINSVVASLHRDAMKDTKFVIQIVFQPVAGKPVRNWWWRRRAYKQVGYLRKEKALTLPGHDRPATPQEKKQADKVERKARNPGFYVTIRVLVIGCEEYTRSRLKEMAGGFNVFEDPASNQYLDLVTASPFFEEKLEGFAQAVHLRSLGDWSLEFRASPRELAGLVSIPDRNQSNLETSQP